MSIPDRDLPVPIGATIADRYVVTGILGRGGMGLVLAGRHVELGQKVAIKFLNREHAAHADRFFGEARAASRIRSEHVVRIFDVGRLATGEPYLVMEQLEGEDLAARLERVGRMSPTEAADAVLDVCQALAEAHAAGIVHRDLKPANVFLSRHSGGDEIVKLLDFGVAKVPDAGSLTKSASVLGSPAYMSPEQIIAARDVDARSDIWSLGVILYELLTGDLPFEGASLVHLAFVVKEKETPRVSALRSDVPPAFDDVISRCLAKNRDHRFANVAELAEALEPFVSRELVRSIARIRRVVDPTSAGGPAGLASTLAEPSGPELPEATPSDAKISTDPDAAPMGATLAAVSTSTSRAVEGTPPPSMPAGVPSSRRIVPVLAAIGALAAVSTIGALLILRASNAPSTRASALSATTSASAATVVPEPMDPVPSAEPAHSTTPPPTPSTSPVVSSPPVVVATPRRAAPPTPKAVASSPSAAPTSAAPATAKAAPNCNPPYTIDAAGVRRAKVECL